MLVLFDFGTGSCVKSKLGQRFLWGGEVYSGRRCKKRYGFQKPRAFWSAVWCLGNQTADQKNSRKSWMVLDLFLLIPENADQIC